MRITILVEGKTEQAFKPHLVAYLRRTLKVMPQLVFMSFDGRLPTGPKLSRIVHLLLSDQKKPSDGVIALTDVYTGSRPPDFESAADAKQKMRESVGSQSRFYPHVALHDFEAWLLPYWATIQEVTGSNRQSPAANPETVNHQKPPAHVLDEIFKTGPRTRRAYQKVKDGSRILQKVDLALAIQACTELRAFIETITRLAQDQPPASASNS